jgi:hypothetical protein
MEMAVTKEIDGELRCSPTWYRALSLAEHVAEYQGEGGGDFLTNGKDDSRSARRFQAWKAQRPFEKGTIFAERLAQDSISEEGLLALLSEPAESLRARISAIPDWLPGIRDA